MHHPFYNDADCVAHKCATFGKMSFKSHDLDVNPTSVVHGILVEATSNGILLAVQYPNGVSVRNNFDYAVRRSPLGNSLVDIRLNVHPLD